MFFLFSKVLAFVLTAQLHSVFCLLGAGLCSVFGARRLARRAVVLAFLLPLIYSWTFVGEILVRPLENHIGVPAPEQIDKAKGIIVLGGFTGGSVVSEDRGEAQISSAGERFLKAVELARLYPDKPVWFSGFSSQIRPRGWSEAEITRRLVVQLGLPLNRFSFEEKSQNTAQNADFMFQNVQPQAGEKWILVTSASHMKRSLASFRKAGWDNITGYPVSFKTTENAHLGTFSPGKGFSLMNIALHEYVGYLAYWLSGRI